MDIVLVSEHAALRDALAAALREALGSVAVHHAEGHAQALARIRRVKEVDLVLLDLAVNGTAGIETLTRFREKHPRCRIVAFSAATEDRGLILSALHAGAVGYLVKSTPMDELRNALWRAAGGEPVFSPSLAALVLGEFRRLARDTGPSAELSEREREVLQLVARGHKYREIGEELHIAEKTVENHVRNILGKLHLNRREELIRFAVEHGLD